MQPISGFKTVTGIQLVNGLALLAAGRISFRCFRVYLATFAVTAVREAAKRSASRQEDGGKPSRYSPSELGSLCGASTRQIQADLNRLSKEGLISFFTQQISISRDVVPAAAAILELIRSPHRPIPVPRAVLRFLAGEKKQSVSKVMIAYMLRGLSLSRKGAEVSARGSVKLSWIAQVSGLSERAARYARQELIALGWMERDTGSTQWKLNRDGAYFSLNLNWLGRPKKVARASCETRRFAPRHRPTPHAFAAPIQDRKTPNGSNNQKASFPGFSKSGREADSPRLYDVQPADLRSLSRCESLYWQAVDRGWLSHSEHAALNFLSASVRARSIGEGDSVRVFVGIVRQGLWRHITFGQEEQARRALARMRETKPMAFRFPQEHPEGRGIGQRGTDILRGSAA